MGVADGAPVVGATAPAIEGGFESTGGPNMLKGLLPAAAAPAAAGAANGLLVIRGRTAGAGGEVAAAAAGAAPAAGSLAVALRSAGTGGRSAGRGGGGTPSSGGIDANGIAPEAGVPAVWAARPVVAAAETVGAAAGAGAAADVGTEGAVVSARCGGEGAGDDSAANAPRMVEAGSAVACAAPGALAAASAGGAAA